MARRFQNQHQLRRSSSPNRSWSAFVTAAPVTIPAASKILLGSFALSNTNIDETVLRTVGIIAVASDQQTVTEDQIGAIGIQKVTEAALTIGITAIPSPVTDGGDDGWLLYVPFAQRFCRASDLGITMCSEQYPFDSKAKRTVEEGVRLAIVGENAHATEGLEVMVVMRLLSMVKGT